MSVELEAPEHSPAATEAESRRPSSSFTWGAVLSLGMGFSVVAACAFLLSVPSISLQRERHEEQPSALVMEMGEASPPAAAFELVSVGTRCRKARPLWIGRDVRCKERCTADDHCEAYVVATASDYCELLSEADCTSPQPSKDSSLATYRRKGTPHVRLARRPSAWRAYSVGMFCDPQGYLWSGQERECRLRCELFPGCGFYTQYSSGWCQLVQVHGCDREWQAVQSSAATYARSDMPTAFEATAESAAKHSSV